MPVGSQASVDVHLVDDQGVHLTSQEDVVVDVLFDDRRIWSFWTLRDTQDDLAPWPSMLRRFLNGTTNVSVVEHVSRRVALEAEVSLGEGGSRIAVVDPEGRPLGIDKSNRITTTFDTRDPEQTKPLLDSTESVLTALLASGVDAFPAYGTLLGAIREHDFIGHDSDVDLGYVSRHEHPVDVIRESFQLQRDLTSRGFSIDRYSAAAFKVDVVETDGRVRGLDVFGGFFLDDHLYLMGEVGVPFEREWIFPLGTCTLAGRTLPAPARPDKLLEAMYGPSWRVPDPAFRFETPASTHRRLNGWFRGIRVLRNEWDRRYSTIRDKLPPLRPSPLARRVAECEGPDTKVVDVGAGRGTDSLWLARRGVGVITLDYAHGASNAVREVAAAEGLDHETWWMNLHETRSVLAQGMRVARLGEPVAVMANHLIDATDAMGLAGLIRFARMALAGGGRFYTDFWSCDEGDDPGPRGGDRIRPVPVERVVRALTDSGAVIVSHTRHEQAREGGQSVRPVARLVAEWRDSKGSV